MDKIEMTTPIVEMDGDEMAGILWKEVKRQLVEPFVELKEEYYDLSIRSRDATEDQVTIDSAMATKKYGVAVKCATITANLERMQEFNLKKMYKSPNATIRSILDGTVFRTPILIDGIDPLVKTWKKPITLARHAYGDVYRASEMLIPDPGKVELVYTRADGSETRQTVHEFTAPGVVSGMHNLESSITGFARTCMNYALSINQDLLFSSKDTISKVYDRYFKDIFKQVYLVQRQGHQVRVLPHRRRSLPRHQVRRRLRLGHPELRRRRDERHAGHGLRLQRHDDFGAHVPRREVRV